MSLVHSRHSSAAPAARRCNRAFRLDHRSFVIPRETPGPSACNRASDWCAHQQLPNSSSICLIGREGGWDHYANIGGGAKKRALLATQ